MGHNDMLQIPNFCRDRPFGFSVHWDTLFAQAAVSGFQLAGCTDFFVLSLIFSRTFLVRRDALILPRCVNLAGLLCIVSFDYVCIDGVRKVITIHGG